MSYKAWYNEDADYNTNARSYMDYLARHNKFMKVLVEDYEVFKEIMVEDFKQFQLDTDETIASFQSRLDNIQQEMTDLFIDWLEDGTLETIINENIFNGKASKSDLEQLRTDLMTEMQQLTSDLDTLTNETSQINDLVTQLANKVSYLSTYTAKELGINNGDDLTGKENLFDPVPDGSLVQFEKGATYYISDTFQLSRSLSLDFNGATVLFNKDTSTNGLALNLSAPLKNSVTSTALYNKGDEWLTVSSTSDLKIGDMVFIDSYETYHDSRDYYKKGGSFVISNIRENDIRLHRQLPYSLNAGTPIVVYEKTHVTVKNLNLLNTGTLERGTTGLQLNGVSNSIVSDVTVDKCNINFSIKRCVNVEMTRVTPLRSWYTGTDESYGIYLFESTGTNIRNSIINSGRHGLSISGFKNSFDTYVENCSIGNEDVTGVVALDHHASSYNSTFIRCTTHGANFAGNVSCYHVDFMVETGRIKAILLERGMLYDQANFTFSDCYFSDGNVLRVNAGRINESSINNRIGQIIIRNCRTDESDIRLLSEPQTQGLVVALLHITGTNNISLTDLCGQVDLLIMEKMTFLANKHLITTVEGVNISNLILRDIRAIGGSGLFIRVHRLGKLLMDNCQFAESEKALHFSNGGGSRFKATLRNNDFEAVPNGIRFDDAGIITIDDNEGYVRHTDTTVQTIRTIQYT